MEELALDSRQLKSKTDAALYKLLPPLESPDVFKRVNKGKNVPEEHSRPNAAGKVSKSDIKSASAGQDLLLKAIRDTRAGMVKRTSKSTGSKNQKVNNKSNRPDRPTKNRNFRRSDVYKKGTGLSPTTKAVGLVTHAKEAFIKIDKASQGIKTAAHLKQAATYIARNGTYELFDGNGEHLDYDAMKMMIDEWSSDDSPMADGGTAKYAEARRLILSCPKGSDPELVLDSAKQFAKEFLTDNGYDLIMALHCKDEDHPDEPDHPHVHILLKAKNDEHIRFNPRKDDLKFMRERFAAIAKQRGLNINATPRAVRGVSTRSKPIERYHHERRAMQHDASMDKGKTHQSQAQKWAIERKKKQSVAKHPYRTSRDKEVIEAVKSGKSIKDHELLIKAKQTREQVKANAAMAVSALNQINDDAAKVLSKRISQIIKEYPDVKSAQQQRVDEIKSFIAEKQRLRKVKNSEIEGGKRGEGIADSAVKSVQSQAQKWAIERKKKRNLDR